MTDEHRPCILTVSGHRFYFDRPEDSVITIVDIAHALSMLCRFNGHTHGFYSVAEHSVLGSLLPEVEADPDLAREFLMHDAAEAFVGDMTSPLGGLCPDYKAIKRRVENHVASVFGLRMPLSAAVHDVDMRMLRMEQAEIMRDPNKAWPVVRDYRPAAISPRFWSPERARSHFLRRAAELRIET